MAGAAADQRARLRGLLDHHAEFYPDAPTDERREREHQVWSALVSTLEGLAQYPDEARDLVMRGRRKRGP